MFLDLGCSLMQPLEEKILDAFLCFHLFSSSFAVGLCESGPLSSRLSSKAEVFSKRSRLTTESPAPTPASTAAETITKSLCPKVSFFSGPSEMLFVDEKQLIFDEFPKRIAVLDIAIFVFEEMLHRDVLGSFSNAALECWNKEWSNGKSIPFHVH